MHVQVCAASGCAGRAWTATATSTSSTTTTAGALDGNAATRWSSAGAQTGQSFTVDMLALRTFNQITVDAGTTSTQYPRHYALFVSNDGVNFGSAIGTGSVSGALAVMNPPTQTARYLKIVQDATNTSPWSIQELNVFGPSVAQSGWNATPSSTGGTDLASNAIDGLAGTRWTSGAAQSNGQTFQVDLGATQIFNQITLDAGTSTGDYPRGYSVSLSSDGTTFGAPVATGVGTNQVVTINFATTTARAIRITQTGTAANAWSIHELNVARVAQPCDTATCTASDTCHAGICDPNTGLCSSQARSDGQACNDGSLCTINDTCLGGVCQGGIGTTCTAGPNVTFYQSYDNGTTVDFAAGSPYARVPNPLIQVPGVYGPGIDSTTSFELSYATNVNMSPTSFVASKPGSFSMWIKPSAQYSGFFVRMFDNNANTTFDLGGNATAITAQFSYGGGTYVAATSPWTPDARWHLIVVNWSRLAAEISIDGVAPVPTTFGGGPSFVFGPNPGNLVYAGAEARPSYAKDEFLILNRPLTNSEIQSYYQQGKAGGMPAPNPIIAQLNAGGIACNPFDDLNPCTADSCDPSMGGVKHVSVDDGTPCSDANMCNGAETCHSGVCTGGTPVACADACHQAGSCDPPTGTCTQGPAIDKIGCNINLRADGVVDLGNGTYMAVFGHNSMASTPFQPATNTVSVSTGPTPQPLPPPLLAPGNHPGSFLPTFAANQTVTWTVDGQTKVADKNSTKLTPTAVGTDGLTLTIEGVDIVIKPELAKYLAPPTDPTIGPEPQVGLPFNGALTGSLSVNASGAAIYTLPIMIPPGIAGMAPNLNLVYNSQTGPGIAGQGWEMTGLSAIHLCGQTRAQDGVALPIKTTGADEICLDGKRLFRHADSSGTTYSLEQQDFSTITQTEEGYLVVTKSGEMHFYGSKPASRVTNPIGTYVWALDRVEDVWGNYYDIHYNDGIGDFTTRGVIATSIEYTGHLPNQSGSVGLPPGSVTPIFETLTFTYDKLQSQRSVRFNATVVPRASRLKSISSSRGTCTFSYNTDIPLVDRMIGAKYCPTGGVCISSSFDWGCNPGEAWLPNSDYVMPEYLRGGSTYTGTSLIDIDGDGLVDVVRAKEGHTNTAWHNTGSGWEPAPASWVLPAPLFTADDKVVGSFVDFDGDGLVDFEYAPGSKVVIYLNRIRAGFGWSPINIAGESLPSDWQTTGFPQGVSVADMDGDGQGDLVRIRDYVEVLHKVGTGTWALDDRFTINVQSLTPRLADLNRDGLPDIGSGMGSALGLLNTGAGWQRLRENDPAAGVSAGSVYSGDLDGDGYYDELIFKSASPAPTQYGVDAALATGAGFNQAMAQAFKDTIALNYLPNNSTGVTDALTMADVNVDGLADIVWHHGRVAPGQPEAAVLLSNGTNWIDPHGGTNEAQLVNSIPKSPGFLDSNGKSSNGIMFVDLNGDGVPDLVDDRNQAWIHAYRMPVISGFPNGLATPSVVHYKVITMADARSGSNPTYTDHTERAKKTSFFMTPLRVVASVDQDNGAAVQTSTYQYEDLRASAAIPSPNAGAGGRGPVGFRKVIATTPVSSAIDTPSKVTATRTTTTYAQVYPYIGLPISVVKESWDLTTNTSTGQLSTTTTTYCDSLPDVTGAPCTDNNIGPLAPPAPPANSPPIYGPRTTVFVYPIQIKDSAVLRYSGIPDPGPASHIDVQTDYHYDGYGNPVKTTVKTSTPGGEIYIKETVNDYELSVPEEVNRGKPKLTTVTTTRTAPADGNNQPVKHVTAFEYKSFADPIGWPTATYPEALSRRRIEPDSTEPNAELDSVFEYDQFGNVARETACASDFQNCQPGLPIPTAFPFRTTETSFDPGDFDPAPAGVAGVASAPLPYGPGRFPVRIKNGLGHLEYRAYDPVRGVVLQETDANGVQTCHGYDPLGRPTATTERCGSVPITTTYQYFKSSDAFSSTITLTTLPNGNKTWAYADRLGTETSRTTHSFDGGLIHSISGVDLFERPHQTTKPYLVSEGRTYDTIVDYDELGRPYRTTADLGETTNTPSRTTSVSTINYLGLEAQTTTTVSGVTRIRSETKNVMGKVAKVIDAFNSTATETKMTMYYLFDADGNLTRTSDSPDGSSPNTTHVTYDSRGRKIRLDDPDLGTWRYTYNGFGDLTSQTDAKNQVISMTYDKVGRMIGRIDSTGASQWVYDSAPGAGKGRLAAVVGPPNPKLRGACSIPGTTLTDGNRPGRSLEYTQYGQVLNAVECVDGESFVTTSTYDGLGRQQVMTYPDVKGTRVSMRHRYTTLGYLNYISDDADGGVVWMAKSINAAGQVTAEITRNGVETTSDINRSTGWLQGRTGVAHADGETVIQGWQFDFDEAGNLTRRLRADQVNGADSVEILTYDMLDRLKTSEVQLPTRSYDATESYDYDAMGNLTRKGSKMYGYTGCSAGTRAAGPHAVCDTGGPSYVYDANGNVVDGASRTMTYNPSNKVTHIDSHPSPSLGSDTGMVDFVYGADATRVVQVVAPSAGGVEARTIYVGLGASGRSLYERTTKGTTKEHVIYLYAGGAHGGSPFAMKVITDDGSSTPSTSTRYNHFDHLGSVTAQSDERGHVAGASSAGPNATAFAYDSWGARRNPDGTAANPAAFILQVGHREYTGHETIPSVGLVNMNGRVYDPMLGRFLSPDPTVQLIADPQAYNRYSYVRNNPLKYTDPTGYTWKSVMKDVGIGLAITAAAIGCAYTEGAGCVVMVGIISMVYTTSAVYAAGGSSNQALVIGLASAVGSLAGGFAAGALAGAAGSVAGSIAVGMVSGAVSGGVSAAISSIWLGGSLGMNIVMGASMGALWGGLSAAAQAGVALSQASAAGAQGGGGSGEAALEASNKTNAASAGSSSGKSLDTLFNEDRTGLSSGFMDRMQPVFDDLNVDLSDVEVQFGGNGPCFPGNPCTVGNTIYMPASATNPANYDQTAGNLLHELGHVVQFANAGGDAAGIQAIVTRQFQETQMAIHMYGTTEARYWQTDPYLKNASLGTLTTSELSSPYFTLDAQADRFRDVLLASRGRYGF